MVVLAYFSRSISKILVASRYDKAVLEHDQILGTFGVCFCPDLKTTAVDLYYQIIYVCQQLTNFSHSVCDRYVIGSLFTKKCNFVITNAI